MNRTIVRAVEVLDMLSKNKDGLTLKEITDNLDIPKSSAFGIVQTLVKLKLADTSLYNNKRYILGSKIFSLGIQYASSNDVINLGSYYLKELAEKLHKTAFIGVLDDDKVVYVYKWQPNNAKLTSCNLGTRNELYCTSLGKALLAYTNPEEADKIMSRIVYEPKTERTITNTADLKKELKKTRQRGYSLDDREIENHMVCMGAPIFDYTGNVVAAISVSDLFDENYGDVDEQGREVRAVADKISSKLGYISKT